LAVSRQWRIAPEQRQVIAQRYSEGYALREVAAEVGVNYKTARRVVQDAGMPVRGGRPGSASKLHRQRSAVARWYGWHAEQVDAELEAGRTVEEIAKEAGLSPSLLRARIAGEG
jgi:transposase-like protein